MKTVQDLIDYLMTIEDKNRVVVLSRDPEGNGYDTWHSEETMTYDKGDGCVYEEELTEEMRSEGYCEDDVREADGEEYLKALVLWP